MRSVYQTLLFCFAVIFSVSCRRNASGNENEIVFWCSNNNPEIKLCTNITTVWNNHHSTHNIHIQPIPEGQSSEEVILAAVVGKTTPDIYANMWQGNVEMYAHARRVNTIRYVAGFYGFYEATL